MAFESPEASSTKCFREYLDKYFTEKRLGKVNSAARRGSYT